MSISLNGSYAAQTYPAYHAFRASSMIAVAISASTATYSALVHLLQDTFADCNVAFFVLITDPITPDNTIQTQLNHFSALPILEVTEPIVVRPHYVYLVRSTGYISFTNGQLGVEEGRRLADRPSVIGHFFKILADHYTKQLVALVLPGSAYNISGLHTVRRSGGVVLAHDTPDGTYDETRDGAVQRGLIDRLITRDGLSEWIRGYQHACATVHTLKSADDQAWLQPVFDLCRYHGYSTQAIDPDVLANTLARRQRLAATYSLDGYLALLRERPEELQHLLADLVSNSSFCHDQEAIQILEQIVVPFLCSRSSDLPIRIWIVGCDTGDAAYLVALLLHSYCHQHDLGHTFSLFATEKDESIIAMARQRSLLDTTAASRTPKYLQYLQEDPRQAYEIHREIRASITFARHDPLRDPPLRRIDLLICPTLFFDQQVTVHEHLLHMMHYSLRPDGLLLLGAWSTPQQLTSYFAPVAIDHRLYRPSANVKPFAFSSELPASARSTTALAQAQDGLLPETILYQRYLQQLTAHAPPSVLINERYDILYLSRPDERLLPLTEGAPASNLLRVLPSSLLPALRVALFTALQTGKSVTTPSQQFDLGNEFHFIRMHVQVLQETPAAQRHLLIIFYDDGPVQRLETSALQPEQAAHIQIQQLRHELESAHEAFAALRTQYEQTIEQQQINNADMHVMIEELTADYHEIQSINEELHAIKSELTAQNEEITNKQAAFHDLLEQAQLNILFVDEQLRVVHFTPSVAHIFHIHTTDRQRPLADIPHVLDYPDLLCDSEQTLRTGRSRAWVARHASDDWYCVHMCPCFNKHGDANGVALLFINTHSATVAEKALAHDAEMLAQVVHELERELGQDPRID